LYFFSAALGIQAFGYGGGRPGVGLAKLRFKLAVNAHANE